MKTCHLNESDYPYETLGKFGITREMIEDLPMNVLEDLSLGRLSPVLPMTVKNDEGETVVVRSRLAFIDQEEGLVDVLFYPVLKDAPISQFSESQQKLLLEGKLITADIDYPNGKKTRSFVQIDPETHQVLSSPASLIDKNLELFAETAYLRKAELQRLQNGQPLTFVLGKDPATLGVDLTNHVGVRFCMGDEEVWKRQAVKEWGKYSFGCYGCWVTDDDGNHDYVPEENYTEEIWEEQKKTALRNTSSLHK